MYVSHTSINNIAESTESTAEAIQKQAVMCSDIQGNTDAAENGIHEMIEASRRTDETVKAGAGVVRELKEQAHNVPACVKCFYRGGACRRSRKRFRGRSGGDPSAFRADERGVQ